MNVLCNGKVIRRPLKDPPHKETATSYYGDKITMIGPSNIPVLVISPSHASSDAAPPDDIIEPDRGLPISATFTQLAVPSYSLESSKVATDEDQDVNILTLSYLIREEKDPEISNDYTFSTLFQDAVGDTLPPLYRSTVVVPIVEG